MKAMISVVFFFPSLKKFFLKIGAQLLYNVVLVSPLQQSESVICIHIFPLFWISFPSRSLQRLSRVPCTTQQVLISYLFYTLYQQYIYVNPSLPIHPPPLSSWVSIHLFPTSCLYFCFANMIIYTIFVGFIFIW